MKTHPIFLNNFLYCWLAIVVISILKFNFIGLPELSGYEKYGITFWTIAIVFWGYVSGSLLYWIIRLFTKKLNNKLYMICIIAIWLFLLIIS
jgi:hypothetical protein